MASTSDPVLVAPGTYKLLLENEHVRVLDVRMRPGEKSDLHEHPNSVWHLLAPIKARFTAGDGTAVEGEFPAGVMWRDAEVHGVENIGNTDIVAVATELK